MCAALEAQPMAMSALSPARRDPRGKVTPASYRREAGGGLDRLEIQMASDVFAGSVAARLIVPRLQGADGVGRGGESAAALAGEHVAGNALGVPAPADLGQEGIPCHAPDGIGGEVDELVRIAGEVIELVRVARCMDELQRAAADH